MSNSQKTERDNLLSEILKKVRAEVREELEHYSDEQIDVILVLLSRRKLQFRAVFDQAIATRRTAAEAKDSSRPGQVLK